MDATGLLCFGKMPWGSIREIARAASFAATAWFPGGALHAQEHPCRSMIIASGDLVEGSTVSSFQLLGDSRRFKLGGLLMLQADPTLEQSEGLILHATMEDTDRYGRIAAQAFIASTDEWLQGRFLRQGLAVQYALGTETGCLEAIRTSEHAARRAGTGVWSQPPVYSTDEPDDLLQHIGEFVIVTGIVKSIGDRKSRLYLNFGSNWAEDVTATVMKKGSGAYRGDVAVLQRLEGKRVEIRGIVEDAQGPLIRLIDEAQIDILSR